MKITKQTGLFIVLGVSLAINVYIIGTVGVYAYKFRTIGEGNRLRMFISTIRHINYYK